MKINKKLNKLFLKLVVSLFVLSGMIVFAANNETVSRALSITRPDVKINMSAVVKRNEENVSVTEVEAVHAGEILVWNLDSANEGNAAANNYSVVGQIPEGTTFVAGSAYSPKKAAVTYSIDKGKDFSAQPLIDEKQSDGSVKRVPAPVSMYTHVRFAWNAPLAPNQKLQSTYRVRVK